MLVVVSGPPAAGKTPISNALAERLADAPNALDTHEVVLCDGIFHEPEWRARARDLAEDRVRDHLSL